MTPPAPPGNATRVEVDRRDERGGRRRVGSLARDERGTWFEYAPGWLEDGTSLSPFALDLAPGPQRATDGLPSRRDPVHGPFADALPDGWGRALMDRAFRRHGLDPADVGALGRLSWLGSRGQGALAFEPAADVGANATIPALAELGTEAARLFDEGVAARSDGELDAVGAALVRSGGSGGARPKALLWERDGGGYVGSETPGARPVLAKFTSAGLPLGHDEGRAEAAYLELARRAGLDVQRGALHELDTPAGPRAWLVLERFDCTGAGGRLHLHSASGLLGADHRLPSLDYRDLLRANEALCRSPAAGRELLARALFNLLACNRDDHAKNWAWLQADDGTWRLSPAYDLTYSPSPSGEHMTSFGGHGAAPPVDVVRELARLASVDAAGLARTVERIDAALADWASVARGTGVSAPVVKAVAARLARVRRDNAALLGR